MLESSSKPLSSRALRIIRRMVLLLIYSYGFVVLLLSLLSWLNGDRHVILFYANTFLPLLWIPAVVLLPVCLMMRWWLAAGMVSPIVIAFALIYGARFLPKSLPEPEESETFTLLSYNIKGGNHNDHAFLTVIIQADADVILLQELSGFHENIFATRLQNLYPYQALHPTDDTTAGQGILSRYPISDSVFWEYDWVKFSLGHQRAVVEINGEDVVIYNVHPTHPGGSGDKAESFDMRNREISDITARAAAEVDPVIIAGDFNMSDMSDAYREISSQFSDAYRIAGFGMGFTHPDHVKGNSYEHILPANTPLPLLVRLDYVFYSPHFQAINAKVWHESGGSDHRPILVQMAITP